MTILNIDFKYAYHENANKIKFLLEGKNGLKLDNNGTFGII